MTALQVATLNVARQVRRRNDEESQHQQALVQWAGLARFPVPVPGVLPDEVIGDYLFAIPNGGGRGKAQAGILKAEGVKAGVWDMALAIPMGRVPGLWIEMKAGKNSLSPAQTEWGERMQRMGYKRAVCWDWESARDKILAYLGATPARVSLLAALDEVEEGDLAHPKPKPVRSAKYLAEVRKLACMNCGIAGHSEAAHPNTDKGMGTKADDNLAFPLCANHPGPDGTLVLGCHRRFDQHAMYSKAERRTLETRWGRMTFGAIARQRKVPMGMPIPKFKD